MLTYTHLKNRPKSDRALSMLQKIASLVKPIMRKHGWVLPVLAEFFPDSPNLVGVSVFISVMCVDLTTLSFVVL